MSTFKSLVTLGPVGVNDGGGGWDPNCSSAGPSYVMKRLKVVGNSMTTECGKY